MPTATADHIEIRVESAFQIEERLNSAVKDLQALAVRAGTHGILVTRLEPGHFRVSLSDQVPFGVTRESTF
ncbi:hypothetical protein [Pseudarthrobacter sp. fls2-241-R2A-168]|uniref:hypothetical protein n=1 Tax=Pseudarthrobacter sp. fls2-241-R2A-168 TaxID=3040304 RepID=UPI0025554437|nr:hypothetical protein [Pseudarthrobacter sp. fls2-241-R2A-168]